MHEIGKFHITRGHDQPHPQLDSDGGNPGWEMGDFVPDLAHESLHRRALNVIVSDRIDDHKRPPRPRTDRQERDDIAAAEHGHDWLAAS